jgi:V/A-type H+-transporting ATPase subunit E
MGNKLQELTDKLYNEGLSKGQQEAEIILQQANAEADRLIAGAKTKAAEIEATAKKQADETKANANAEIRLAGRQIISEVRQSVENMLLNRTISGDVNKAFDDIPFIQELILTATQRFSPDGDNADLFVVIPEAQADKLQKYLSDKVFAGLAAQPEVRADSRLKAGFRIGSRKEGYYLSFTDEDFDNLFKSYLRPKVSELLFG